MKKLLLITLLASLMVCLFHTYFSYRFPYTNDGENHLARFANYKIALKEGQFPPRFAPNLINHYGYPVFNYNYPLANILSLPFSILKINPEISFKTISIVSYLFGLIGIYKLAVFHKKSFTSQVVGILLFGLHPYLANLILFRGSIGELLAITILPWVVFMIDQKQIHSKVSLPSIMCWSFLLLSHNVTVLIAIPWLALYIALKYWRSWDKIGWLFIEFLFAFGLTAWFWIPAVGEMNEVILRDVNIARELLQHFSTTSQLFAGALGFGFSYSGPIDSLGFQIGFPHLLILIVNLIILLVVISYKKKSEFDLLFLTASAIGCIFFQLEISKAFWNIVPFFQIIQFPWRLSILLVLLVPLIWLRSEAYFSYPLKKVLIVSLISYAFMLSKLKPVDFFHREIIDYDFFSQSTSTQNENTTKGFTYAEIGNWEPKPMIQGEGIAQILKWNGSRRSYTLDLKTSSIVIEPTMNFLGWQTVVRDEQGHSQKVKYMNDEMIKGRIAYSLSPGKYQVFSRFTQFTKARLIGNSLSILTILLYLGFFLKTILTRKITTEA